MRLVTWNCQSGSVTERLAQLERFAPDVVALQEVRQPDLLKRGVHWRGQYALKGLAVAVVGQGWTGQAIPLPVDTPLSVLPVHVTGPVSLTVVGVWTHQAPTYVEHLLAGMAAVRPRLQAGPVVVLGDFNSAPGVDTKAHDTLVQVMGEEYGLVSAYHRVHGVEHGKEPHPSYYHRRKQADPWHLDFCFIPQEWADRITRVEVGSYEDWPSSDHRPVLVELDLP